MKRFFYVVLLFMLCTSIALAETVQMKVSALEEFKTENPPKNINVSIKNDTRLGEYNLKENDVLECNVLKIVDPRRGKRSASFYVQPISYKSNGTIHIIENDYFGKYSKTVLSIDELKQIPPGSVLKKAALLVGGHFVKGLSAGVHFAEGAVKNKDNKPIKSGLTNVYKESPLSYVEKGEELDLKQGDIFYLVFKITNNNDEPNYSYTVPAKN